MKIIYVACYVKVLKEKNYYPCACKNQNNKTGKKVGLHLAC